MIILILVILVVFAALFTVIWIWFFKSESPQGENFYKSGEHAFEEGDYKKAKELLSKAVLADPKLDDAKYNLGVSHLELKEYDDAKKCFEQVLKSSPKDFNALLNMGKALQYQNDYDGAAEYYEKAIQENDESAECHLGLGRAYFEKKDYTKALEFFKNAVELSPDDVQALFYIAKCKDELCDFDKEGDSESVIAEYSKIAGSPDLPPEYNTTMALAYAKTGKIEEATEYCRKALAINAEDVEAHKLLGLLQFITKDLIGAKSSLSIALSLKPKDEEAHEVLSYVLCQQTDACAVKKCREKYYELIKKFLE